LTAREIHPFLRTRISEAELQATLVGLLNGGFLKADGEGFYRLLEDEEYVQTSSDIPSEAIRAIHRAQLARALEALDTESVLDREFIAKTLVVSKTRLPTVKRLIREKLEELAGEIALAEPGEDAVVSQLNVQFYLQSR
jgi:uncharacterized protein (TIGR02147 family)